eukprot:m.8356 g.8356  ORF g.8356 m.8356 type:complete len:314 (-) comp2276_c0_seq1:208-1149(-)
MCTPFPSAAIVAGTDVTVMDRASEFPAAADMAVVTAAAAEIPEILAWAVREGWNPGTNTAMTLYAADHEGCSFGQLADGTRVSCLAHPRYGDEFAYFGLYLVPPEHRGRGYGLKLFTTIMDRLTRAGVRTIALDAVDSQLENYKKLGFVPVFHLSRYLTGGLGADALRDPSLVPAESLPLADVLAYDRKHFLVDHAEFVQAWMSQPGALALALVREGQIHAYAVRRPSRLGYCIGPLFADTPADASTMLDGLRAGLAADAHVTLDILESNAAALAIAAERGMKPVFTCTRMYHGPALPLPIDNIFGATSWDSG